MTTYTSFTVKLTEIDRMGIVHHSNYPIWFETARKRLLKKQVSQVLKLEL